MSAYHLAALVYLGLLALFSALLTICDKRAAKRSRRRVPERMRLIRHKTLHRKFMLGLPALLALQVALLVALHLLLL